MPEIRIIHTSEFLDCLTPEKAALLRRLKEEHGALLIDAGDAVRALNVTVMPWRERAVGLMNAAGYDAMGLGNREYFFRQSGMRWKTGHAGFARVSSNCRGRGGSLDSASRAAVLDAGGVKLGLIGVMPTMIEPGHFFERLSDMRFPPWQDAAREAVEPLVGSCDIIVALFHRPDREIDELLEVCPEVKLVLAGHQHILDSTVEVRDDGRIVSRVGEDASHCRVLGLRIPEGTVTMDELVGLDAPRSSEET